MDFKQVARDIIKKNIYLTLATANNNSPWASPVYYCVDKKYNFYFLSSNKSRHAQNTNDNPLVAAAIFDSHQKEGTGNGVQMSAKVEEVSPEELNKVLAIYRTSFMQINKKLLSGDSEFRIYRLIPIKVYVLHPEKDIRVEVKLI